MALEISVSSGYFYDFLPEEAIEIFLKKGYSCTELAREHCEMLLRRGNTKETAKEFCAFLKDKDFSLPQGHLTMKDLTEGIESDFRLITEEIELCKLIGVENIVLHIGRGLTPMKEMPYKEKIDIRCNIIRKLLPLVEGTKFNLCIENLVANMRKSQEFFDVFERINSDNLKVCFDSGHLNQTAIETQLDFIKNLGEKISAIHLNDNDGKNEQHLLPYSLGLDIPEGSVKRIDFDEVCMGLAEIQYKGVLNFEVPGEREAPLEIRMAKLGYIKQIGNYFDKKIKEYKII